MQCSSYAVWFLAIVFFCFSPSLWGQSPVQPRKRGADVVEQWSLEVLGSVERKAAEAERAAQLMEQIRRASPESSNGEDALLLPSLWPKAYADALHQAAEAHGLFPPVSRVSLPAPGLANETGHWAKHPRMRELQPLVLEILEREGLPPQLLAIPLIESGFNPAALSPKGARGLWQLMPETARRFGLNPDGPLDERLDPVRSTVAAARYLKELYALWGDWALALAAYNAGEQRVQQALARSRASDFWTLAAQRLLPEETRQYVPAVLSAARRIGKPDIGKRAGH